MICPTCNTVNRDDAKFCKSCGKRLSVESAPSAAAATTASAATIPTTDAAANPVPVPTYPDEPGAEAVNAAAVPATPAPAQAETAASQQAPGSVSVEEIEDISQAPTQILTPQQMMAYNVRRWQQEAGQQEQGQQAEHVESASPVNGQVPTATQGQEQAPQMINSTQAPEASVTEAAQPSQNTTEDVADMPTVIITPRNEEEPIPVPPPPPPSSLTPEASRAQIDQPVAPREAVQTIGASDTTTPEPNVGAQIVAPAAAQPTQDMEGAENGKQEEPKMQEEPQEARESEATTEAQTAQSTAETGQAAPSEQAEQAQEVPTEFAVLAVGTMVGGRYEISGVVSAAEGEHTYQVIDRQGYQKCWNCGSTQNAEGDEFCIDCGAELLNIPYVMHEYSSAQGQQEEAAVLQGTIVNTFVDGERTYAIEQPLVEQNAFPNGVHLLVATDSDAGNVRRSEPNEDSTLALLLERVHESMSVPVGIFIIADGLGGHDNGQLASRVAINVIAERVVRDLLTGPLASEKAGGESAKPGHLDEDAAVTLLHDAVADANDVLVQMNQKDKTDMGSTLTGFMVVADTAYIVNVGDSRTYMVRGGKIYQLTTDHSLVGQLVAGGLIQPEDVYTHPQRSQIFRSLGDKHNVQIDIFKQQLHPSDILLSCSDGLWEMVRNPQLESILTQATNPQAACTQLIETANANGGEDNVSAVVVFVS